MKLATIRCRRRAAALLIASAAVSAGMLAPAGASATGYLYCDYPVARRVSARTTVFHLRGIHESVELPGGRHRQRMRARLSRVWHRRQHHQPRMR